MNFIDHSGWGIIHAVSPLKLKRTMDWQRLTLSTVCVCVCVWVCVSQFVWRQFCCPNRPLFTRWLTPNDPHWVSGNLAKVIKNRATHVLLITRIDFEAHKLGMGKKGVKWVWLCLCTWTCARSWGPPFGGLCRSTWWERERAKGKSNQDQLPGVISNSYRIPVYLSCLLYLSSWIESADAPGVIRRGAIGN